MGILDVLPGFVAGLQLRRTKTIKRDHQDLTEVRTCDLIDVRFFILNISLTHLSRALDRFSELIKGRIKMKVHLNGNICRKAGDLTKHDDWLPYCFLAF